MIFKSFLNAGILMLCISLVNGNVGPPDDLFVELTDHKWDQIQKGQWLIGFFSKDSEESGLLENDWSVLALKCKEQGIHVGKVLGNQSPGLDVRFLVTTFPKVFYVKNGVAHEIPKASRSVLVNIIKDKEWDTLKPVAFMYNPFSIQMSIVSHLFIHAVNLYNYEDAIVQKFIPFASATDLAFGLTFIVIGTTIGLIFTCLLDLVSMMFFSSKDSKDFEDEKAEESEDEKVEAKKDQKDEDSAAVRKRK